MAGWRVELNLEKPAILNLGGYVSGSKMQLQGDPLFLVDLRTERYHIAAPPGVCGPNTGTSYSATGATADPRDRNKANASNPGSRYLWAGYMYLTPIVGVWNGSSIQGSQSGINKLGQYHCWNRTYDVSTGRWTTPDINRTTNSNVLHGATAGARRRTQLAHSQLSRTWYPLKNEVRYVLSNPTTCDGHGFRRSIRRTTTPSDAKGSKFDRFDDTLDFLS